MASDADIRESLVETTRELFAHGLLTATGGNLSAVAADGETIWITPTRLFKGGLAAADLVRIDRTGRVVEGRGVASLEWRMHVEAYRARPEARAAVHTHAPIAIAFGITNQAFPPINSDAVLLRDTRVVPWHLPGSPELAQAVGAALHAGRGCLLQNHGLMTVDATLRGAATLALMIEETARIVLLVRQFGGPVTTIPPDGIERLKALVDFA